MPLCLTRDVCVRVLQEDLARHKLGQENLPHANGRRVEEAARTVDSTHPSSAIRQPSCLPRHLRVQRWARWMVL